MLMKKCHQHLQMMAPAGAGEPPVNEDLDLT
jgi:hypothetical protein